MDNDDYITEITAMNFPPFGGIGAAFGQSPWQPPIPRTMEHNLFAWYKSKIERALDIMYRRDIDDAHRIIIPRKNIKLINKYTVGEIWGTQDDALTNNVYFEARCTSCDEQILNMSISESFFATHSIYDIYLRILHEYNLYATELLHHTCYHLD